ncbi:hypothetical protein FJZ53_02620 [Candidatus Woesearchaeota archaeon]|nr:hypothetical protein [Candidatus Woesearchaeota archaeon]
MATNYLGGKLRGSINDLAHTLLKTGVHRGVWLSFALSIEEKKLNCYTNPKNLIWHVEHSRYLPKEPYNVSCDELAQFDITALNSKTIVDLDCFEEEFIKLICGNSKSLMRTLTNRKHKTTISLPDSYGVWPGVLYAWNNSEGGYADLRLSFHNTNACSQGVKVKK